MARSVASRSSATYTRPARRNSGSHAGSGCGSGRLDEAPSHPRDDRVRELERPRPVRQIREKAALDSTIACYVHSNSP